MSQLRTGTAGPGVTSAAAAPPMREGGAMPTGTGFILAACWSLVLPAPPEPAAVTQRRQACKGGDGDACNSLGVDFAYGRGVPRDEAEAAALYRQACEAGNSAGCNNLGEMYAEGKGVAADRT